MSGPDPAQYDAEAEGCDAAPTMIDLARTRVGDQVELRVHSIDEPFTWIEDGSIDVVVCALAYHYVSNRDGFLREAHRTLRSDGALLISTHQRGS